METCILSPPPSSIAFSSSTTSSEGEEGRALFTQYRSEMVYALFVIIDGVIMCVFQPRMNSEWLPPVLNFTSVLPFYDTSGRLWDEPAVRPAKMESIAPLRHLYKSSTFICFVPARLSSLLRLCDRFGSGILWLSRRDFWRSDTRRYNVR